MQQQRPMKLSAQLERPQSPLRDFHVNYQAESQSIILPDRLIGTAEGFDKKDHAWYAVSQVPTDLSIQVQDITFYIHKYPLVSRCGYFGRFDLERKKSSLFDLKLENFPGGSDTFETIMKFCYGLPVTLNPTNVAALRCASEFLEMTEALEDGNLISRSEAFFTFVVLASWRDSITVLKSCESLSPWGENLQIVRRCCDTIAWKIPQKTTMVNGQKWSFDDLATLRIQHFTRIVTALRAKGAEPEIIGLCIMQYADKWLPNVETERDEVGKNNELQWSINSSKRREWDVGKTREQRIIIESLVSILPPQKEATSCKFILKMLKMATLYSASPALVSELEKRAGMVLESANVDDLLIPNYPAVDLGKLGNSTDEDTTHNTDVVQRILEYFLLYEQQQHAHQHAGPLAISKLLDNYLAEIARDPKLPVTKFQVLSQSLPENARICDDGLYRAIDIYLKTHPLLSEHERRRICKVMDCGKLSLDACSHAAQNDRLPLRTLIQVLFSEQVKIRASILGISRTETPDNSERQPIIPSTTIEVKVIKTELDKIRMQIAELQRNYLEMRQENGKQNIRQTNSSVWSSGWRRIRKSARFHVKIDGEEIEEKSKTPKRNSKDSSRRRQSIS